MGEEVSYSVNDAGDVIVAKGGQTMNLGPEDQAAEEMARFLAERDFGERQ